MATQYSMLPVEEVEATSYWFTSRGPTPDGAMPTLCAPGGAIAPIPRHALQVLHLSGTQGRVLAVVAVAVAAAAVAATAAAAAAASSCHGGGGGEAVK